MRSVNARGRRNFLSGDLTPGIGALVLMLALVAALGWSNSIHPRRLLGWHEGMPAGTAAAPDQYRVLTPTLADLIFWIRAPEDPAFVTWVLRHSYFILHFFAFTVAGFFFLSFCRRWMNLPRALLCVALLMGISSVSNLYGFMQVTDPLHLMFVTIGLWAIQRRVHLLLVAAMVIGATNREGILVLAGYYALMEWPRPRREVVPTTLLLVVVWAATYGALRLAYGPREYAADVVMLAYNFGNVWVLLPLLLLLVPLGLTAFQRPSGEWPAVLRRAALVAPPFILLHLVIARVEEVRLLLPLLPVLIPLAVLGISEPNQGECETETAADCEA